MCVSEKPLAGLRCRNGDVGSITIARLAAGFATNGDKALHAFRCNRSNERSHHCDEHRADSKAIVSGMTS